MDGIGSSCDSDIDRKSESDRRFIEGGVAALTSFSLREEDLQNNDKCRINRNINIIDLVSVESKSKII